MRSDILAHRIRGPNQGQPPHLRVWHADILGVDLPRLFPLSAGRQARRVAGERAAKPQQLALLQPCCRRNLGRRGLPRQRKLQVTLRAADLQRAGRGRGRGARAGGEWAGRWASIAGCVPASSSSSSLHELRSGTAPPSWAVPH